MDRDRAREILAAATNKTIVVVGDLMLDRFVWGTVDRISPEAPVPVVRVVRESCHLGGAGNVAGNIAALGGAAIAVGVTGAGPDADRLREALGEMQIGADGVLRLPGRATTVKTRVIAHGQQVVRFDREQDEPLDPPLIERLAQNAMKRCVGADALVISDYEKGCVTPRLLERLLPAAAKQGLPVVVDPKPGCWRSYQPITAVTPNQGEAARMTGTAVRSDADATEAAEAILGAIDCRGVLLTRGAQGMLLLEKDVPPLAIPAAAREVFDVTGAGDTVAAALALCLAAGASLSEAAVVANAAAGVVVGKVGTATATAEEILAAF